MNYDSTNPVLSEYLLYIKAAKGLNDSTANAYFLDLRTFFRFLLIHKNLADSNTPFDEIDISCVDKELLNTVQNSDLLEFLIFTASERPQYHKSETTKYGNAASTRARKISALRSFFKFLKSKNYISVNPADDLPIPKQSKKLPKFLLVDECVKLLDAVDGQFKERDYCILMLFLNCGLRVSELVGINTNDIEGELIRVTGKGNKQRILYLNEATRQSIDDYLKVRLQPDVPADRNALFVSRNRNRINVQTVKWLVNKYLGEAGLSLKGCSAHKLRHTAATLMYQNGTDIRTVQEFLGHEQLNTTMIYTHIGDTSVRDAINSNPLSNIKKKNSDDEE